MNTERALLGALLFLAILIGSNLIMYGIVRGASKGDSRWLQALTRNLGKPLEHMNEAMDELHQRVQELTGKKEK